MIFRISHPEHSLSTTVQHRTSDLPTSESEQTMMDTEDAVMGDAAESPLADPFIIARVENFPDGGVERKLLEDWLNGSSKAAQAWVANVNASKFLLQTKDANNLSLMARDINNFKGLLGIQDDISKTFSSHGVEPEVLKTLFGDPREYHVKPCSDDSLPYLLLSKS